MLDFEHRAWLWESTGISNKSNDCFTLLSSFSTLELCEIANYKVLLKTLGIYSERWFLLLNVKQRVIDDYNMLKTLPV